MSNLFWPIRQIAYAVTDVVAAAEKHHAMYGSGPFFLAEHVPVENFKYRGQAGEFDHTTLFGQWGDIMVEFSYQHNDGPSQIHDMFPFGSGKSGLQHVALIVSDFDEALASFNKRGYETASQFYVGSAGAGYDVAFLDTRELNGHMVEIYPDAEPLMGAYEMSRKAGGNFSGQPLIQKIQF